MEASRRNASLHVTSSAVRSDQKRCDVMKIAVCLRLNNQSESVQTDPSWSYRSAGNGIEGKILLQLRLHVFLTWGLNDSASRLTSLGTASGVRNRRNLWRYVRAFRRLRVCEEGIGEMVREESVDDENSSTFLKWGLDIINISPLPLYVSYWTSRIQRLHHHINSMKWIKRFLTLVQLQRHGAHHHWRHSLQREEAGGKKRKMKRWG